MIDYGPFYLLMIRTTKSYKIKSHAQVRTPNLVIPPRSHSRSFAPTGPLSFPVDRSRNALPRSVIRIREIHTRTSTSVSVCFSNHLRRNRHRSTLIKQSLPAREHARPHVYKRCGSHVFRLHLTKSHWILWPWHRISLSWSFGSVSL